MISLAQLNVINEAVNIGDKYITDREQYKVEEYWANADQTKRGDCEDLAEAKYQRLRDLGWPQEALNLAICKYHGVYHAVLIATYEDEDYVLDNNADEVLRWQDLPNYYELVSRTDGGSFQHWYEITA